MSYYSDLEENKAYETEIAIQKYCAIMRVQYRNNKLYWECKNGNKILVQDMTNDHLKNSIAMLKRKSNITDITEEWIRILTHQKSINK